MKRTERTEATDGWRGVALTAHPLPTGVLMTTRKSTTPTELKYLTATTLRPAPNHTPQSLVAQHGETTKQEVIVYIAAMPVGDVFASGQRVATTRVVDDGVRILGLVSDFMASATPEQRELLVVIDGPFMAAACTTLVRIESLGDALSRRAKARKTRTQSAQATTQRQLSRGRARRDLYCASLVALCGGDAERERRLRDTTVAVASLAELADSLDALAAEAKGQQTWLRECKRETFLDDAWIAKVIADAQALRKEGGAHAGVPSRNGELRGDLDWWEGACLWFLGTAVSVFGRAHTIDPAVPKLVVRSLRSVLAPNSARKRAKDGDVVKQKVPPQG